MYTTQGTPVGAAWNGMCPSINERQVNYPNRYRVAAGLDLDEVTIYSPASGETWHYSPAEWAERQKNRGVW